MTQSDEKELVLGNKQLISLFFVVVALCGVFFAMGYMIGHNATKTTLASNADATSAAPASEQRQQPEPPRETAAQPDAGQPTPASDPPPTETKPAQDGGALPPAREYEAKPAARAIVPTELEAGASYIQVAALSRSDADAVVRTLREQTFPAVLAASSKEGLFRVLVGPYQQTTQLADAKNRLKTLGFANTIVQKQ